MAPNDTIASTGRRWRRVGGVLGLLLVAGAIALGVVYSNNGGHGSSATSAQQGDQSPDTSTVDQVLDALKNLVGGDATAASTDSTTTTTVVVPQTASKDGVVDDASNMAGSAPAPAPAPGPQGIIQTMSAAAANSLGMKVCTPNNGAEFVSLRLSVCTMMCTPPA